MKSHPSLKECIIIACLFIAGIITVSFAQKTGKENIRPIVENALSQTIDTDYYRRIYQDFRYEKGKGVGRKIKGVQIQTGEGLENILFEDSIEEERGLQLVNQYMFTKINPLKPHDFNLIFQEELAQRGVTGKTGAIYYYENIAHSSEENLEIISSAIQSDKTFIDAKKTAAVKVWVECNLFTTLRHSSPLPIGLLALNAVILIIYIALITRKRHRQKTQEFHRTPYITITANEKQTTDPEVLPSIEIPILSVAEKGIRIDKKNRTAYIDGKILPTTPMTFSIFLLLSENIEKPITRQQIEQELWENADKETEAVVGNRLHQNISKLRKALKDFPQYEIVGGKGKGYKLTLVSTANGTEGT